MNTPNPLVPQGSLQQQPRKKITVPVAVFTIVSLHVLFIGVMLIQGCNHNAAKKDDTAATDTNSNSTLPPYNPATNYYVPATSNVALPIAGLSNTESGLTGVATNHNPIADTKMAEPPTISETKDYSVAKHDTFTTIAKKHGISLTALQKANPGVDSRKLTVGQKIKLPGGIASTETPATNHSTSTEAGDAGTYSVKAGDTLTKIAKAHGTTAKKLKAFNNLATDQLQVGRKLKIPAGGATGSVERLASAKPDATTPTNDPVPAPTASTNVLR